MRDVACKIENPSRDRRLFQQRAFHGSVSFSLRACVPLRASAVFFGRDNLPPSCSIPQWITESTVGIDDVQSTISHPPSRNFCSCFRYDGAVIFAESIATRRSTGSLLLCTCMIQYRNLQ